jgi:Dolichyl-phosphate-mannose-protein mannosyltransferase
VVSAALAQSLLVVRPAFIRLSPSLHDALQPMWPHPDSVAVAVVLYLVALAGFGWSATRLAPYLTDRSREKPWPPLAPDWQIGAGLAVVGLAWLAWVSYRLATTPYNPSYPRWWSASLLLLLASGAWLERDQLWKLVRSLDVRRGILLEAAAVGLFVGLFLWLCWNDQASWFYSSRGDEYPFYYAARDLALGQNVRNLFAQAGVFGIIPVLSAYFQGMTMRLTGLDEVGWKVATAIPVAVALIAIYGYARLLYQRRVALATLAMLATAHYLLGYSHVGYANLESVFTTALALLWFELGCRKKSWLFLALSGVWGALGWYTFYSSRVTLVLLGLFIILSVPIVRWLPTGLAVLAGFIPTLLPMALVNRGELIARMLEQSGEGTTAEVAANRALLPFWNIGRSLLAFNYNEHSGPYVAGSLAEPVTAMLFVLGLGFAIASMRDGRSRTLLAWFALAITTTGILSKYDYVSVSRLHYVLPVVALLAALALDRLLRVLESWNPGRWDIRSSQFVIPAGALGCAAVLVLVTYANLHRWHVEMPPQVPSTPEAVAVWILELPQCSGVTARPLVVNRERGDDELILALLARGDPWFPSFATYDDPPSWLADVGKRCIVFRLPYDPGSLKLIQQLERHSPGVPGFDVTDPSGERRLRVYYPT